MKKHKVKKLCLQTFSIPKKIKLLGTSYKVKFSDSIYRDETYCAGFVQHAERVITLSTIRANGKERSGEDMLKTFFHELSHALDWITDIGKKSCNGEIYASISGLFWSQVFNQIELIDSVEINKTKPKTKSSRRKK